MRIERIPLHRISPAAYNPRRDLQPGDPEYQKLARSIDEFGLVETLVWNERTGNLVGGHQRLKVLRERGYTHVEASVVDLDEEREKALNVALNKISGAWDDQALASLLTELQESGHIELTGFDAEELDQLLRELGAVKEAEPEEDDFDPDAAAAAIEDPVTQRGDVWRLGPHRLICGDATDYGDLERLMAGATAQLVVTDPPYNVNYTGKTKDALKIQGDKQAPEAFRAFLTDALTNLFTAAQPGAPIYVFHADSEGYAFRGALVDAGWLYKQSLVWVKNTMVLGRQDYQWKHEPILYGWRPGAAHSWYGERDKTTVFDTEADPRKLAKKELVRLVRQLQNGQNTTVVREDKPSRSSEHPTMKPIPLIGHFLQNSSLRGDRVLDTFAGSGSTLVACHQIGRVFHGMELDPRYCDVIVQRWERLTGEQATREE